MRPHIFIATPCFGGLVTQGYMQSVVGLIAAAPTLELDLSLAMLGQDALITRARNTLVGQFLHQTTATHLLFVDSDISFQPIDVVRLVEAAKPLVAGIYPLKSYYWDRAFHDRARAGEPIETAGLHYVGTPAEPRRSQGDLVAADFAGTGFMLIQRMMLERMISAYPETRYSAIDAYRTGSPHAATNHALFDCQIEPETGSYRSEDFVFCSRWRKIGGEVWLDTGVELTHTGPSDFKGTPRSRYGNAG
ncbi:hypothetical protein NFI95_04985 [Acetobacteraceae bacterium KSS8]|uniref:Glycosyltransferase n=1 Tax=Endosaccharibacter trunci TaxID=2812733 RepID=A0ABT1W4I7_9PROT|nr:hypothetical protein [Acetobacteraceae bacterium KSS8]